ncbi:MAG: 2-aminobenzoate-CoA ligase [Burkholderiales bacterium]|nr:MAG: 2-aminobenzoate-CoA ligase [Betaproteobacteria bacterium]TAG24899.1 MAG: 2-aminobenzoate-CoA ligase [Burkholderiales bacterium]
MATAHIDTFVYDRLPPPDQRAITQFEGLDWQCPERVNLVAVLLDDAVASRGFSERVMLRSDGQSLTYGEALLRVNQICRVLVDDLGLQSGQRVLLRGGNSIVLALSWLAVVKAGGIAVATMPLLRAKELGEIIEKSRPSLTICEALWLDEMTMAIASADSVHLPVVTFNATGHVGDEARDLMRMSKEKPTSFDAVKVLADDIALLAFTSGTTGKPKAVCHSHCDVLASCQAWPKHVLQLVSSDIVVGSPPLAFTFGLGAMLIYPMWAGASVYFPAKGYTPESMVQTLNRARATVTVTAPTFYRQMAPFAATHTLPSLRLSVSAGEGLPDATRGLWRDATGVEMIDGIGATEMFHIFISSAGSEVKRGAIGKVVPGYQAKVVDENGNELPRGKIGKLAVIGPTSCKYLDDPRQTNYVKSGWNYPGDAFLQDEEGYFVYQSRADDMIITAGYNVGGPEVEDALMRHEAVAECGVIGKPDDERGMIVKAFVVLKPGFVASASLTETLQAHVKATIAPYKYPREIEFLASLPRTETGKLQRFKLKGNTP